jgi:hypothetical protein
MSKRLLSSLVFAALLFPSEPPARRAPHDTKLVDTALEAVRVVPEGAIQYDYVMTARLRMLVFWAGKDDVGGGYIRRGRAKDQPRKEFFQVLFGSDPAKAPRAINRWGAGTEISWHRSSQTEAGQDDVEWSTFFGFMKSSKGKSVSEMQEELKKESVHGQHLFTGILSTVEANRAASLVVPLPSEVDFNFEQYREAEPLMMEQLRASDRPVTELSKTGGCASSREFLGAVAQLVDQALAGKAAPLSRCYVYDAQVNTLTLERATPLAEMAVHVNRAKGGTLLERDYRDLIEAEFTSEHQPTKKRVHFTIVLGTRDSLSGVPVQIRYQPNWWFQVVLNLRPPEAQVALSN